jgi:hypothetical protein
MKRWIALLLSVLMCLSLIACDKNNDSDKGSKKQVVVGKWESQDGDYALEVNKNETGILYIDGTTVDFTWIYDKATRNLVITPLAEGYNEATFTYIEANDTLANPYSTAKRVNKIQINTEDNTEKPDDGDANPIQFKKELGESHPLLDQIYGTWNNAGSPNLPDRIVFNNDGSGYYGDTEITWTPYADTHNDIFVIIISIDGVEKHTLTYGYDGWTSLHICSDYVIDITSNISIGYIAPYGDYYIKVSDDNGTQGDQLGDQQPEYEAVELTVENWFDYFEVVETVEWRTNAFNEVVGIDIWHCFRLKEEWGQIDDSRTEIVLEYGFIGCINKATVDFENKTYQIGELVECSDSEVTEIIDDFRNRADDNGNYVFRCSSLGNIRLGYNEEEGTIHYYANFNPIRVWGTLYLIVEQ